MFDSPYKHEAILLLVSNLHFQTQSIVLEKNTLEHLLDASTVLVSQYLLYAGQDSWVMHCLPPCVQDIDQCCRRNKYFGILDLNQSSKVDQPLHMMDPNP